MGWLMQADKNQETIMEYPKSLRESYPLSITDKKDLTWVALCMKL